MPFGSLWQLFSVNQSLDYIAVDKQQAAEAQCAEANNNPDNDVLFHDEYSFIIFIFLF